MASTESFIEFKHYTLILKRHWLPASAIFVSVLAFTAVSVLLAKPTYEAQGMLRFKRANTTSSLTELGKEIGQLDSLAEENNPLNTEAVAIRSASVVQKTIAELNLKDEQGAPLKIEDFLKRLSVTNVAETDVLQISYKGRDPEELAAVVNTLMAVYLKSNLVGNRAEAVATREFIEKELPRTEATTRQAEATLRQFEERNKVVDLQEEARLAVEVIAALDEQIAQAQAQLANTNAKSAELRNKVGMNSQAAIATSSLSQSPGVQQVLQEFQQLQGDLALQRTRYQETHPVVVSLKDREAALKAVLKDRVRQVAGSQKQGPNGNLQIGELRQKLTEDLVNSEVARLGLAREVSALSNQQSAYKQRVNTMPKLKQIQRELERRLEAAQSTYAALLKQLQEARITENQNVGNARILESALIPQEPVAPQKALYLVTGGILGFLLSIATALVLDARDRSVKTVEEARELFGFPMLGVIPSFKKAKKITPYDPDPERSALEIVVRNAPHSPISAMFRMLQANLKFLSADKQLKVVVVTSSIPQEGKSVVSANLTATMAQLGHRVLLVDADMHRPTQHHIWEVLNEVGLSDVLIGQAAFQGAVKTVMPNLDILTAGAMPPNPVALLDSRRMAGLIETFSASYDFVIIDTPSLNVDADALTVGKMADGVLLVVRPGVVDSASATFAKEFLQQSGQNVLGQVVNGVIPENEPYSYYHSAKEYYTEESGTTNGRLVTRTGKL